MICRQTDVHERVSGWLARKPAHGLLPRDLPDYLGRVLAVNVEKDRPLYAKNFR